MLCLFRTAAYLAQVVVFRLMEMIRSTSNLNSNELDTENNPVQTGPLASYGEDAQLAVKETAGSDVNGSSVSPAAAAGSSRT